MMTYIDDIIFILSLLLLYIFPKKSEKHKWFWIIPLAIFLINIGIRINFINQKHKSASTITNLETKIAEQKVEINNQKTEIEKLYEKAKNQEAINKNHEKDIKDQLEYGDIAQFNWNGFTTDGSVNFKTPYSDWYSDKESNHEYVRLNRKGFQWDCDTKAKEHYKTKIKQMPRFPFPYVVLSTCLKLQGDTSWHQYAAVAKNILSKTIKVPGPHVSTHKFFLQAMEK